MEQPLYKQLYSSILEEIKAGKLKRGDRVPSEKELADQFKVSRITSKKALETLVQAGLIERARGRGSFVSSQLPDLKLDVLAVPDPMMPLGTTDSSPAQPLIGLILEDFSPSYGLRLLKAVEQRCSETNCHLLFKRTYGRRDEEEQAIHAFQQLNVDGLIIYPVHGDYYNASLLRLALDGFPMVIVDRYLKRIEACAVYTDNKKAGQELTEYLLQKGHQSIGFVSPPEENTSTIEERIQGYSAAFIQHGLKFDPQHCFTKLYSTLPSSLLSNQIKMGDYQALRDFIAQNQHLTAFIACEYNIALILVAVLSSMGKQVPQDCEVVCFDYPDEGIYPPLFTHILQDETSIGRQSVDLLLAQLKGEKVPLHNIVAHKLVENSAEPAYTANLNELVETKT